MAEETMTSRVATALWRRRNPGLELEHPDREIPHLELRLRQLPRYALDQTRLAIERRRFGVEGRPWITGDSRAILETMLRPTDRGLEFGSGGSTEWFARHVEHLWSVEAFPLWHRRLAERLARNHVDNVDLELVSADELGYETAAHRKAYVHAHPQLEPGTLDLVFIDGEYRDDTALRGAELLRSGGLLVLDNANAYLPGRTRSPWKVSAPASNGWKQLLEELEGWRHLWTTNGAWDTALWIKP